MNPVAAPVIPSSMVFYTNLPRVLIAKNPSLAQLVINALNKVDRESRNHYFRQVMGDEKVIYG